MVSLCRASTLFHSVHTILSRVLFVFVLTLHLRQVLCGCQPELPSSPQVDIWTLCLLCTITLNHPKQLKNTKTSRTTELHTNMGNLKTTSKKMMRNVALEKGLLNLGVSEEEIYSMTKIQQSVKYNAIIQEILAQPRFCIKCGASMLCSETAGWYCTRCFK